MIYSINEELLTNIADSIRLKTETEDMIAVADMADIIKGISTGTSGVPSGFVSRTFTQSANGTEANDGSGTTGILTNVKPNVICVFELSEPSTLNNAIRVVLFYAAAITGSGKIGVKGGSTFFNGTVSGSGYSSTTGRFKFATGTAADCGRFIAGQTYGWVILE